MFDALAAAVEDLEVPVHGEAIAAVLRLIDLATAKVCEAIGAFDRAGLWELDGATSMTAWLRHYGRMTNRQATCTVRTAKRLRDLPVTADAWRDGALSGGQVQAVVANLDAPTAPRFAAHEVELVPLLARLAVA